MKNKENMNNHKHEPYRLLWVLIACSAAFWAFGWIATHFGCISADIQTGIVLTFVGILATFVVVSNYMQVKDIESRVKDIENSKNDLHDMLMMTLKYSPEFKAAMYIYSAAKFYQDVFVYDNVAKKIYSVKIENDEIIFTNEIAKNEQTENPNIYILNGGYTIGEYDIKNVLSIIIFLKENDFDFKQHKIQSDRYFKKSKTDPNTLSEVSFKLSDIDIPETISQNEMDGYINDRLEEFKTNKGYLELQRSEENITIIVFKTYKNNFNIFLKDSKKPEITDCDEVYTYYSCQYYERGLAVCAKKD
jgi:hypothetical protein